MNLPELRAVVSNTGPLISALQCGRMDILRQFYDLIHIPASEMPEYEEHGAKQEIRALVEVGFIVVHDDLTASERELAREIAQKSHIRQCPGIRSQLITIPRRRRWL